MHYSKLNFTLFLLLSIFCSGTFFLVPAVLAQEAAPERIWDRDLKRWLTPEELGHLEVYFTEEDAAKVMFPDSDSIEKERLTLTPDQKTLIENRIGWKFPEHDFTVYMGKTKERIDGYAIVQNTIGKHRPITYMVSVDLAGEVMNFEVLVYRESRGNEIAKKRFNFQYQGKEVTDPIRINRDIINISGATMSVRSASAGVKRVLVLVDEFYLKPRGLGNNTVVAGNVEKGFLESLLGL